jgi:hypothetical protein
MSWVITGSQPFPAVIGEAFGGGYFAGYISHTADGNPTHALIVAPRATGATGLGYTLSNNPIWAANALAPDGVNYSTTLVGGSFTGSITGTTMTVASGLSGKVRPGHTITGTGVALGTTVVSQVSGTTNGIGSYTVSISQEISSRALTAGTSEFDGVANGTLFKDIDNTVGSGSTIFPQANFCEALTIGGYTDWYWPSRYELDIAYFNLKPDTTANSINWGINNYSVPKRINNYTANYPAQTSLTLFNTTSQNFVASSHWSSTEFNASQPWNINFNTGEHTNAAKSLTNRVRAFRRIAL